MSQSKIEQRSSDSAQELGDETFMSATELRNYMKQTEMAKASKDAGTGRAEEGATGVGGTGLPPVGVFRATAFARVQCTSSARRTGRPGRTPRRP